VRAFAEFLAKLPDDGLAVIGIDNPLSASLTSHDLRASVITFGLDPRAWVRAANLKFEDFGSTFDVLIGNRRLGSVSLRVPGTMNVQNALAAIAVGHTLGLPFTRIASALQAFRGVRRRFDILVSSERMTIVDDYAHHPTAVRATIAAARGQHRGTIVVAFQPHRYTRTAFLAREFADALRDADRVYLAPVYAASEPAIPGVSERSIGDLLAALGAGVNYVTRVEDLEDRILAEAPPGAMVLMLGAGNITEVAARMAERLSTADDRAVTARA
jgi:UDP-N-acetylmuramate--alanine ligase